MTRHGSRFLAGVALAGVLLLAPAFAQETGQRAENKSAETMGEKPSLEIWKWANFAMLAGLLGYLISKHMGPMLVARSAEIREGLAAGERAKADADARAAAVVAKLAGLGQAVAEMKAGAREEREREAARLQRATTSELARMQQQSLLEIESAGKLARIEVQRFAAKLAIDLAEQKVRARMSGDVQAWLLDNFAAEIGARNAAGHASPAQES